MKNIWTRILVIALTFSLTVPSVFSQIYLPDGLRMPGNWNSWVNTTGMGGNFDLKRTSLGTLRWKTTFQFTGTSGLQNFKFVSTGTGDPWHNQWGNATSVQPNILTSFTYGTSGISNSSVNLTNAAWYTVVYQDNSYANARAIFMQTSAEPVNITTSSQSPVMVTSSDPVEISIALSATPSAEEKFYVRYTTDHWSTSSIVDVSLTGTSGTATIPAQVALTTVEYYVMSTVVSNPTQDFDLYTLKLNNNNGSNYSYTTDQIVNCGAHVVTTDPVFPVESAALTITFDATQGNAALEGYTHDVYAHTGVITNLSNGNSDWKYTKTAWGVNTPETKLTRLGTNQYSLTISGIRAYYGVPESEQIKKLAFVFRSVTGDTVHTNADGSNIMTVVYSPALSVKIQNPVADNPVVGSERVLSVCADAMHHTDLALYLDNSLVTSVATTSVSQLIGIQDLSSGTHWIKAVATGGKATARDSVPIYIRGPVTEAPLPDGVSVGINYIDATTVTLVLNDPPAYKQYAFVIGDFNNWTVTNSGLMNRTPDGSNYWVTITGLTSGQEYAYQYFIDNELRIADPYTQKILDPWNDPYISSSTYPDLKAYPEGKTTGIVSVFQTNTTAYPWQVTTFTPPMVQDLVIYELHIRDFVSTGAIKSVKDKLDYLQSLGINAIELMPFSEFEGNDSWGYNPSFYFAPDKAYGTAVDYKAFVDECHLHGIAVIMDMVLNHSFGQSPLVKMYFDPNAGSYGKTTAQNPWYNVDSPNPDYSWGFDFNHESAYTKAFVDKVNAFWLGEFKIDGFRFDFTKGFTNTVGNGWTYDASRIAILKRMFDQIKAVNPGAYVIIEHLTDNSEEKELANYGLLIWGNMNSQYGEASMGYEPGSDLSWGTHLARGFSYHNLVSYMVSHDEERLMYKNLTYGNSANPLHDVKQLNTALAREELAAAFYLLTPGPKMIWEFGELGYDYSINHCPDGTVSPDCRTSRKPVRWDYYDASARRELFDTYARLIHLKKTFPVFRTGDFTYSLDTYMKRIHLNSAGVKVTLLGNFDVIQRTITPYFQQTGTWYEYFTGEVLNVTGAKQDISLQPGEYRLYTTSKFDNSYYAKSSGNLDALSTWGTGNDGSGDNPADFSSANTNYFVYNQSAPSVANPWTVTGANSRLVMGDGSNPVNLSVNAAMTSRYIQVNKAATLTINPGGALTVNDNLANEAGSTGLVIKSGTLTASGSLIHSNTGVQATAERYIGSYSGEAHGWHLLSSPVNSFTLAGSGFIVDPPADYDFYAWSEPDGLWLNQKIPGNNITGFQNGMGYQVAYKDSDTKTFSGELNVGNIAISGLTHTLTSSGKGWHLLGNPFPSALNWDAGTWSRSSSIGAVPQVWDEADASYKTLTGGIIPALNGFMVYTDAGDGSLTLPADARVHSSQQWYKSTNDQDFRIVLAARDPDGNTAQQTIIRFAPEAMDGFDLAADSWFLPGFAPEFYSVSGGQNYALNTLPSDDSEKVIPLGFIKNNSSSFRIETIEQPIMGNIWLTDLKNNNIQNLHQNPIYSFTSEAGDEPIRFMLRFSPVNVDETNDLPGIEIFPHGKVIQIINTTTSGLSIELFNLQGQRLMTRTLEQGHCVLPVEAPAGLYIVRVTGVNGIITRKVLMK
ncbi:MAG: alpha-amylase family glycosyl hydrolase [Bacteroidales bacterium]|jgi:glycosidase|nr:alpha-amylase family glycosyl hydrolase [Bacteroidales bacterium]